MLHPRHHHQGSALIPTWLSGVPKVSEDKAGQSLKAVSGPVGAHLEGMTAFFSSHVLSGSALLCLLGLYSLLGVEQHVYSII